jgi:Protein of unknown function (DUF1203)
MSPRLDSWWSGSFSLPGREFHPLEAPGLSWRTEELLHLPEVDYIEVRDKEAGCYDFRIERAAGADGGTTVARVFKC